MDNLDYMFTTMVLGPYIGVLMVGMAVLIAVLLLTRRP